MVDCKASTRKKGKLNRFDFSFVFVEAESSDFKIELLEQSIVLLQCFSQHILSKESFLERSIRTKK